MHSQAKKPETSGSHLTERHLAIGRRVAARYPDAPIVYLSGSILDGFATPTSDLDVFVLTTAAHGPVGAGTPVASLHGDGYDVELDYHDDISVDTELWPLDTVTGLPAEFAAVDLDEWSSAGAVPEARLTLAHRVRIGRPVVGAEQFRLVQERFSWSRLALILRNRYLSAYNNLADDAIGAIEAGDAMTALLTSRLALGAATDALTAASGHTNPKEKWRWRKLRALGLDQTAEAYRQAELDPAGDDAGLLAASRNRLRVAAEFVLRASGQTPGEQEGEQDRR
jgi:hypothetical protein